MAAFELKVMATLDVLEKEVEAIRSSGFTIGIVAVVCALGYLDYRFEALGWRSKASKLAEWYAAIEKRPSVQNTLPVEG